MGDIVHMDAWYQPGQDSEAAANEGEDHDGDQQHYGGHDGLIHLHI